MPKNNFVHLHFHTEYSLLDGACKIKEAVKRAEELKMPALTISDHGNLYGAIAFYNACTHYGSKPKDGEHRVKPIIGCEMYLTQNKMTERKREADGSQSFHMLLLAKNYTGYQNLMRLTSGAHLDGFYYKPRIDREFLAANSEGLIATSGCLASEVPRFLMQDDTSGALDRIGTYQDIFGKDNYYLELQDHGLPEQRRVNRDLVTIAKKEDIPLIVTNDVHYIHKEHAKAHEVMLCMQTGTSMSDAKRLNYGSSQFYMKTADEMWAEWGNEYPDALNNTLRIADQVDTDLRLMDEVHFPDFPLPDGHDTEGYLRELVKIGVAKKYDIVDFNIDTSDLGKTIKKRVEMEIGVIRMKGFLNYFIVVQDFVNWARENDVPVGPGRGSGAGSLIAYALNITTVEPLRYNLLFERFLNPERDSPPDFDIDFCMSKRMRVIEYVRDKYGAENTAHIITFGTLGAKTVIRDVGRALDIPLNDTNRLAKLIPEKPGMTLAKAQEENPEFKEAVQHDEHLKRIMQFAPVIEGLPRNPGVHAAGVVMGERRLDTIIPLCKDKAGTTVSQYEMKTVEQTGLLKMDFLGLKTLTVIQEALDNIKISKGESPTMSELEEISLDDQPAIELLQRGDTIGVFQVESGGMQEMLRKFVPKKFEDIIALIALYRPGPMAILDDYIERSHGRVPIKYDHPLLEGITKETVGYMVYQEQVQQAANILAGYSLAEGDLLRRAMGKKKPEVMAEQRVRFTSGCKEQNQIDASLAGKIFDDIEAFAGYGFNKSHSASYAVITMETAWLKARYPIEFMSALMSCDMGNPDKLSFFLGECKNQGIDVRPPSVNESLSRFKPEGDGIRFGLVGIKGVGEGAVDQIIAERDAEGPYLSLTDFCTRLDGKACNKKTLEALVQCGAFDFTRNDRAAMFEGVSMIMERAAVDRKDRLAGQGSLFDLMDTSSGGDGTASNSTTEDELPNVAPYTEAERLKQEKFLIGFYISGHPLDAYQWELENLVLKAVPDIADLPVGEVTRTAGLVTGFRKIFTKKSGDAMCAFTLEGMTGSTDVVMFPDAFRVHGGNIDEDLPIMLAGERMDEENKLQGLEAYPLGQSGKAYTKSAALHLDVTEITDGLLTEIKTLMEDNPGDTPLLLRLHMEDATVLDIQPTGRLKVSLNQTVCGGIGDLVGPENLEIEVVQTPTKRPIERRRFKR